MIRKDASPTRSFIQTGFGNHIYGKVKKKKTTTTTIDLAKVKEVIIVRSDFVSFCTSVTITYMEDKRTWDCVKSPSKHAQLLRRTLLLKTIFCATLGLYRRPPTSCSNVEA